MLDEGQPTEYHARHVEIPFSYLIDQYDPEWGIPKNGGVGHLLYLLGGDAQIHLLVMDDSGVFRNIELPNGPSRPTKTHERPDREVIPALEHDRHSRDGERRQRIPIERIARRRESRSRSQCSSRQEN